jgi:hypothetical protein
MEPMAVKLELLGGPRDGGHTEVIALGSRDASGLPVICLPLDVTIVTEGPEPIEVRVHRYVLHRAKRAIPVYKYEPTG